MVLFAVIGLPALVVVAAVVLMRVTSPKRSTSATPGSNIAGEAQASEISDETPPKTAGVTLGGLKRVAAAVTEATTGGLPRVPAPDESADARRDALAALVAHEHERGRKLDLESYSTIVPAIGLSRQAREEEQAAAAKPHLMVSKDEPAEIDELCDSLDVWDEEGLGSSTQEVDADSLPGSDIGVAGAQSGEIPVVPTASARSSVLNFTARTATKVSVANMAVQQPKAWGATSAPWTGGMVVQRNAADDVVASTSPTPERVPAADAVVPEQPARSASDEPRDEQLAQSEPSPVTEAESAPEVKSETGAPSMHALDAAAVFSGAMSAIMDESVNEVPSGLGAAALAPANRNEQAAKNADIDFSALRAVQSASAFDHLWKAYALGPSWDEVPTQPAQVPADAVSEPKSVDAASAPVVPANDAALDVTEDSSPNVLSVLRVEETTASELGRREAASVSHDSAALPPIVLSDGPRETLEEFAESRVESRTFDHLGDGEYLDEFAKPALRSQAHDIVDVRDDSLAEPEMAFDPPLPVSSSDVEEVSFYPPLPVSGTDVEEVTFYPPLPTTSDNSTGRHVDSDAIVVPSQGDAHPISREHPIVSSADSMGISDGYGTSTVGVGSGHMSSSEGFASLDEQGMLIVEPLAASIAKAWETPSAGKSEDVRVIISNGECDLTGPLMGSDNALGLPFAAMPHIHIEQFAKSVQAQEPSQGEDLATMSDEWGAQGQVARSFESRTCHILPTLEDDEVPESDSSNEAPTTRRNSRAWREQKARREAMESAARRRKLLLTHAVIGE